MATSRSPKADPQVYALREIILGLIRQEDRDLSARQLAVFLICYREDEPQTVRGLAAALNVAKPAITRALDRLEEENFIRRKIDPLDRRSVLAMRTSAGSAFFRDLRQIVAHAGKAAGLPE